MSEFKYYIAGIELQDQPTNWMDFEEVLEYDETLKGLLLKQPVNLDFVGDGYRALKTYKDTNGYCGSLTFRVDYKCNNEPFQTIFEGLIFVADVRFNWLKCVANTPIEDNSFYAKINNNKKLKARLDVPFSKNGVAITPTTGIALDFFTPSTAIIIGGAPRRCFDVMDAITFLVSYMTDGTVGVVSDWYSALPATELICLVQGQEVREHTAAFIPNVSFEQVFGELQKKFNLGFAIEEIAGVPTLRIEPVSYWRNTTVSLNIDYVREIEESIDTELLYSGIEIGGEKTAVYYAAIHSFPPIAFIGHQQEDYAIQGVCNIDKILNLESEFIIDSNIIEELVATNTTNETYDKDVFMVQYRNDTVPFRAVGSYIITQSPSVPVLYNAILTNDNVAVRFNIQGNIAKYFSASPDTFRAEQTVGFTPSGMGLDQVEFDNDYTAPNFDNNNNYGNGTIAGNPVSAANSRYTATSLGAYTFFAQITYNHLTGGSSSPFFRMIRYDSGGTPIGLSSDTTVPINPTGTGTLTWSTILEVGDYVIVVSSGGNEEILAGSYFEGISASNGGGIYESQDGDIYNVSKIEFEKPLSFTDWNTIKANQANAIYVNSEVLGWARRISRKIATGETSYELITNINNIA